MIKKLISKYGMDNLRFWYEPSFAIENSFAMFRIVEEQYLIRNGYKIELKICGGDFKDKFYIDDLNSLIYQGTVKVFVQRDGAVQFYMPAVIY